MCYVNHASECLYANDKSMYNKNEKGIASVFKNGNAIKVMPNQASCAQYFFIEKFENFNVNNFKLLTISQHKIAMIIYNNQAFCICNPMPKGL